MKTNEENIQCEEPTPEASDLLMDSLLQSVADNREGGDDEEFLAGMETLLDLNTKSAKGTRPGRRELSEREKRNSKRMYGGIAAAIVVGVCTAFVVFLSADKKGVRVVPSVVMEPEAADPLPVTYATAESRLTTADRLAYAKQSEEIAKESKDLVVEKIGNSEAELERLQNEISFVEGEMSETLNEKKEIDLAVRKIFPDGNIKSADDHRGVSVGGNYPPSTQPGMSGDISIDAAGVSGSGGAISVTGGSGESYAQIGHGGFDGKLDDAQPDPTVTTPQTAAVYRVESSGLSVNSSSPIAELPRYEPNKNLIGATTESDAVMPPAVTAPIADGIVMTAGTRMERVRQVRENDSDARRRKDGAGELQFGYVVPNRGNNAERRAAVTRNPLIDNPWKSPLGEPLSTFSVDVDTASWTNVRGMLERGMSLDQIPADSVRVEEMINYFDWKYPQPDGDHPFGFAVESAQSPWNADSQLLRVAIQGKDVKRDKRPSANLVFLLDVSGSMNQENKLPLVQKSIALMVEEMNENDCVSIVVYAGAEGVALHPTKGNEQAEIMDALKRLKAGGSTNGGAGINLAYKIAGENFIKGGINRVILCSDGDFNVGLTGTETLTQLVERKAKRDRVFLSVCGFGNDNLNDAMLESITNKGNGTYYFIDTIAEARKVFLKDMMATLVTIAKDVKIQVEFNPGQVKAYRLIGYANRRLAAEDFEDDRVDAGEIGAGHSVTAFYEVVPVSSEQNPLRDVTSNLRYQKEPAPRPVPAPTKRTVIDSPELALLKLRYKEPEGDVSKLIEKPVMPNGQDWRKSSQDFRFASAVALFGMKLRNNESVRHVELPGIIDLAESAIGTDPHGYRAEFVRLLKAVK